MPLNALTLASSQGLIDRPFKQLVSGLTAGTERRVSSGNAGGFYMQGDFLCNDSLELGAQGVWITESTLTESRTTDLTVTARREFAVKAEAELAAGTALSQFRVYPKVDANGVSWEYAYENPIGGTVKAAATGGTPTPPPVTFRVASTGNKIPDGVNALAAGVTKRRNYNVMPLQIAAGNTGRLRVRWASRYVEATTRIEQPVTWSGVTGMAIRLSLYSGGNGSTLLGSVRATVGGQLSFIPQNAVDIVTDTLLPSDFGQTSWPVGGSLGCLIETDAASGTLIPITFASGSSGDSGDGSFDGGGSSIDIPGPITALGGSNGGTRIWRPTKLEIEHTGIAIGYIGDSRPNGQGNQPAGYGLIRGGYAQQAAYKTGRPIICCTRSGDDYAGWMINGGANSAWRRGLLEGCTDIYVDLGFNDVNQRAATVVNTDKNALLDTIKAQYPNARIHVVPVGLRTISASGQWLAPPDQTPSALYTSTGSVRADVNADYAVGSHGVTSILDLVPDYQFDSTTNRDVYFSDGTNKNVTVDGAHFSANGEARVGALTARLATHMASLSNF